MGGSRTFFNDGQELVFGDLNKIAPRSFGLLFDKVLHEILQRAENAFFGDSFEVIYSTATSAIVKSGLGFQKISAPDTDEPSNQPVYQEVDTQVDFLAPSPSLPRIDIVVVKTILEDVDSETRKYKNESTDTISNETFFTSKDYGSELLVVAGTPDVSPAAPAVPAGYMKIATCLITATNGITGQSDITDERSLMPLAGPSTPTGNNEYDKVVGNTSDFGVTHSTLREALLVASEGDKILVTKDETIDNIPIVTVANIEIIFKRGVTFTKGTSVTGLQIDEDDCRVVNGRFVDFDTAGDEGILISAGVNRTMLRDQRFNNCDSNISNGGTKTSISGEITE